MIYQRTADIDNFVSISIIRRYALRSYIKELCTELRNRIIN